jgi:tRNA(Ile)-lysidine synthetase-like protein
VAPAAPDDAPFEDGELIELFADVCLGWERKNGAIVAVSGGPDSLALLYLLRRWQTIDDEVFRAATDGLLNPMGDDYALPRTQPLVVATVDHRLRPESATEAAHVAEVARAWGYPHVTLVWDGPKPTAGIQAAARDARYRLLAGAAREHGFAAVVTAHTLDDQAETVLMRLARGSGPKGLGGMVKEGALLRGLDLRRPLLDIPRARLLATLRAADVPWIDDPSNADPRFLRPRLRRIMPPLAAEGLDARRLAAFAARMRAVETSLDTAAFDWLRAHATVEAALTSADGRTENVPIDRVGWMNAREKLESQARECGARLAVRASFARQALEPMRAEIVKRAIARLIAVVVPSSVEPPEESQLDALTAALIEARFSSAAYRTTLGRALVAMPASVAHGRPRVVVLEPEPPRSSAVTQPPLAIRPLRP